MIRRKFGKKLALGRSKWLATMSRSSHSFDEGDDVDVGCGVAWLRFVKWSEKREGKIFNTFTHSLVSLMVVGTFLHSYF
jgi:hypothetical protein